MERTVHERVTVEEGERVPSGVFGKDELERFKVQGSIGEPPAAPSDVADVEAENVTLKERVEALQAELAAARDKK